jgi:hypothetical protein
VSRALELSFSLKAAGFIGRAKVWRGLYFLPVCCLADLPAFLPGRTTMVCFAKIESAPFAEHIADSHGLKFEIKRSQMPHSDFDKEGPSAWERFSDRPFP